jgi:secreted PhoX family phosphatase
VVSRRLWIAGAGGLGLGAALTVALKMRKRSVPTGLVAEPLGLLSLRPGFRVTLLDKAGDSMSDGFRVPAQPDGMGVFVEGDKLVLLRNHELWNAPAGGAYSADAVPAEAYDPEAFGGVSRLVLDRRTLKVESSNLVLTGTLRNCSGGESPWGWISCEEDTSTRHGFAFLCEVSADKLAKPQRIDGYGRFRKEAVAIEPATAIAYLTEDQPDGCLYRFVPKDKAKPFDGELSAMVVEGVRDTGKLAPDARSSVSWVTLSNTVGPVDDLRRRAREKGASIVRRGEGITLREGAAGTEVFFAATAGGSQKRGQILKLEPTAGGGTLSLVVEAGSDDLDAPDNLCVGPHGHIFIAEDGNPPNGIRVITPDGELLTLAVNLAGGEVAGVCMPPSGDVLFANLQQRGVTLAIEGPFTELA